MIKLKCIMLYDDLEWMGHVPFFRYLCTHMSQDYDLYILLWSKIDPTIFLSATIFELPYRSTNSLYNPGRIKLIEKYLNNIKPEIFLVDFFPFWRFGNIIEINIIATHIRNQKGKVINFMRDIYIWKKVLTGSKYNKFINVISKRKDKTLDEIVRKDLLWLYEIIFHSNIDQAYLIQIFINFCMNENILDAILIFWDPKIFDIRSEFLWNEQEKNIWHHLWYIPIWSGQTSLWIQKKHILISTWWNVTSKNDFTQLIQFMTLKIDYNISILMWPYVSQDLKMNIQNIVYESKHITLSWFSDNFQNLLEGSEYFFWFGWYGTFQHLFHYNWKAYIMANYNLGSFKHRYYEQKYRTKLFESRLNVEFLDDFSDEHLEKCLWEYTSQKPNISDIEFCNKAKLIDAIAKIYNQ